jgi:uncharacterized membrane protein YhaH (DUF805 family)
MGELFNFRGRASRLTYWRAVLLCIVLATAVMTLGYLAVLALGRIGGVVFTALAPILVINLAAVLRRLHDRNKGLGWLLFFQVAPMAAGGVVQLLASSPSTATRLASLPFSLGALGITLWFWIEMGFLRGAPTPNRFGDPVTA